MLGDAVKVVVDRIKDSNADTGKFKLIKLD